MASIQVKKRTSIDPNFLNLSCSPLLKQLYANRGINDENELNTHTANLIPGRELKGIDQACELLYEALRYLDIRKLL